MNSNIVDIDLLAEIGMDKLPVEEQAAMMQEMGDSIMGAVMVRVVPMLDEASQKELDTLLEGADDPQQLQDFLNAKVPEFQQIVTEEVENFKQEALAFYKAL